MSLELIDTIIFAVLLGATTVAFLRHDRKRRRSLMMMRYGLALLTCVAGLRLFDNLASGAGGVANGGLVVVTDSALTIIGLMLVLRGVSEWKRRAAMAHPSQPPVSATESVWRTLHALPDSSGADALAEAFCKRVALDRGLDSVCLIAPASLSVDGETREPAHDDSVKTLRVLARRGFSISESESLLERVTSSSEESLAPTRELTHVATVYRPFKLSLAVRYHRHSRPRRPADTNSVSEIMHELEGFGLFLENRMLRKRDRQRRRLLAVAEGVGERLEALLTLERDERLTRVRGLEFLFETLAPSLCDLFTPEALTIELTPGPSEGSGVHGSAQAITRVHPDGRRGHTRGQVRVNFYSARQSLGRILRLGTDGSQLLRRKPGIEQDRLWDRLGDRCLDEALVTDIKSDCGYSLLIAVGSRSRGNFNRRSQRLLNDYSRLVRPLVALALRSTFRAEVDSEGPLADIGGAPQGPFRQESTRTSNAAPRAFVAPDTPLSRVPGGFKRATGRA